MSQGLLIFGDAWNNEASAGQWNGHSGREGGVLSVPVRLVWLCLTELGVGERRVDEFPKGEEAQDRTRQDRTGQDRTGQ